MNVKQSSYRVLLTNHRVARIHITVDTQSVDVKNVFKRILFLSRFFYVFSSFFIFPGAFFTSMTQSISRATLSVLLRVSGITGFDDIYQVNYSF